MPEAFPFSVTPRAKKGTLRRVARVAGAQWGVVGVRQLADCAISEATVRRWVAEGRLHRLHSGVYAFGHTSIPVEGRLVAALLHAGPGAVLSHATAAWWWGLTADTPPLVHLSSQTRARSVAGVEVHRRRRLESTRHRRFPITTVAQTLLDLAARAPAAAVRQALAEADFKRLLDADEVTAITGQGRPGSATLRTALARHQPRLALTRSELERRFLTLCETAGLPLPEPNAKVSRMSIDFLWRQQRVAVEVDGYRGHRSPAQLERDRRRELRLRASGFTVIRYTWSQVVEEPARVADDLRRVLFSLTARSA